VGTAITSSTSNVILTGDVLTFDALNSGFTTSVITTGSLTLQPSGASFSSAFTTSSNLTLGAGVSGLTVGKIGNTSSVIFGSTTSVAGPITAYGSNIDVNQNLNTSAGTGSGDILLKSSGDIALAASRSITTAGGDVILWANSDNAATNGSISLRNGSSITTGSGSVAGGSVWLGGGADGATWNGLAVGAGYAVPGTTFTPSNGGGTVSGGIYLEGSTINSFGGHVKLAGDASTSNYGILTYATNSIDAKAGRIELDGNASSVASVSSTGVLFGIHDVSSASTMSLNSSASNVAITIAGVGRGTGDAVGLSGTLNVLSTGTGEISINGNAIGTGRSIVAGNYYSGILNAFANSGKITLNGGNKAVQVAVQVIGGQTSGPSKINLGRGGSVTSSTSDVFITGDNIALAASGIAINTTGKVTIEPSSNSFATELTYPINNLSIANTITGLTLGKSTNTQNITIGAATTIPGPISVFGGTIAINAATTATNSTINLTASTAVTQTGAITATNLGLAGAGNFTLTNTSNAVGTLAGGTSGSRLGSLSFTDASGGGLTVGTIGAASGLYASGNVLVETLSGDINLTEPVNTTSNTTTATGYVGAIVLNAGKSTAAGTITGGDIKVTGNGAVSAPNGIAKLYSAKETSSTGLNTLVGGSAQVRSNVDETTTTFSPVLTASGGTKYALYRVVSTISLSESTITIDALSNQAYTGSAITPLPVIKNSGTNLVKDTDYTLAYSGNTNVGTATVTITGIGAYSGTRTVNFTITAKPLTVTGLTGVNKEYNGNATATATGTAALSGVIGSDVVTLTGTPSYTFTQSGVGTGIGITTAGYTLGGAAAGNYSLTQPSLTANITGKALTVTGLTGVNKEYNGNSTATATGTAALSGIIGSDVVTLTGTLLTRLRKAA
jgi:hypothetical protein